MPEQRSITAHISRAWLLLLTLYVRIVVCFGGFFNPKNSKRMGRMDVFSNQRQKWTSELPMREKI
jgi:hypothetical protein